MSRSYSRALDGLVPRKATITSGVNQIRSPGVKSYDDAMVYLTKVDDTTGQTPVDIYVEKQAAWADAQDAWDKAKIKAQREPVLPAYHECLLTASKRDCEGEQPIGYCCSEARIR